MGWVSVYILVRLERFEPSTNRLKAECSTAELQARREQYIILGLVERNLEMLGEKTPQNFNYELNYCDFPEEK